LSETVNQDCGSKESLSGGLTKAYKHALAVPKVNVAKKCNINLSDSPS